MFDVTSFPAILLGIGRHFKFFWYFKKKSVVYGGACKGKSMLKAALLLRKWPVNESLMWFVAIVNEKMFFTLQ